jgi:hypothetical protein
MDLRRQKGSEILHKKLVCRDLRRAVLLSSLLLLAAMCACTRLACAQSRAVVSRTVEQWGTEEIELHSTIPHSNAFTDVTLSATFSQGAEEQVVTGFCDGDGVWRIRFMPQAQGTWHFVTKANDAMLDNVKGSFKVTPAGPRNHGPVRVSHVHHFSYADGTPLFVLGTTMYNWINRDDALQQQTLHTLAQQPFNKVRFCVFPKWYSYNRVEPEVFPFARKADKSFDFDHFNVLYFRRLEQRVRQLQQLGIEADIILFHPYDHWGFTAMGQEHDDQYVRYIAARLSAYRNIWWTMSNEYDMFEPSLLTFGSFTVKPRIPKDFDHLGRTLAGSDPYHHLIGNHDIATWYDANKPWITHVDEQDGVRRTDLAVPMARAMYPKPVLVDEYGYEGNNGAGWGGLDARTLLKVHWELTIAGGYGSHGETYVHPGGIQWWAAGGELIGELPARLGFLKRIMTESSFQEMEPAPLQAMGGAAMVGPHGYSLFYFEKGGPVQVKLEGAGLYRAEVIDPWLMKVYPLGIVSGGVQKARVRMVPELLRFVPIGEAPAGASAQPLRDLMDKFAGEVSTPLPDAPFQPTVAHLSDQYTLNLLLLNPTSREILHRLLPNMKFDGIQPALILHDIAENPANHIDPKAFEVVKKELAKVPAY